MSYKLRNTIVLISLILIVSLISAYFLVYHFPKRIKKEEKQIEQLKTQIATLDGVKEEYLQIEKIIKTKKTRLAKLDKRLAPSLTSAATYHYLNTILNYSGILDFNILFGGVKSGKGYKYNIYNIKGEGNFTKIFKFISYIERGPELYKIKSVNLNMVETKDEETGKNRVILPFQMELWGYFSDFQGLPKIRRTLRDVYVRRVSNPMYPYIYQNIPVNREGLLEVERAELKAVMPDKAMIADRNGKIHTLGEGAKVYLGYLNKIDVDNNHVEFLLNKGGIFEKFILELRFGDAK